MSRQQALARIEDTQIVAILRGDLCGLEVEVCDVLLEAGISAIEVSLVSPDAYASIARLAKHFEGRASIGAGTVLLEEEAFRAADSGATFVVSPNSDPAVIAATLARNMASLPGAYTATEIVQATRWGADAVKIFPAVSLGPEYVSALRGPLPGLRTVPTGGITVENIAAFLRAGSWAVGIGSELVRASDLKIFDPENLRARAQAFAQARTPHA